MNRSVTELLEEARQLSPGDLDWFIQNLLNEGDGEPEAGAEFAWDGEIKRRLDEIDSGSVELTQLDDVLARMDARILARQRG
jgi:hypothetical protein